MACLIPADRRACGPRHVEVDGAPLGDHIMAEHRIATQARLAAGVMTRVRPVAMLCCDVPSRPPP
jgi:hypothetical protein